MSMFRCHECDTWLREGESCMCSVCEVRPFAPVDTPGHGRRMVYIAGPISKGDLAHNINQASRAFEALALAGFAPICPHWSCFSGPVQVSATGGTVYAIAGAQPNKLTHADWLAVDLVFVERSDAVLRLPGESTGADQETAHARANRIPVFNDIEALIRFFAEAEKCPEVASQARRRRPARRPTKAPDTRPRSPWEWATVPVTSGG